MLSFFYSFFIFTVMSSESLLVCILNDCRTSNVRSES